MGRLLEIFRKKMTRCSLKTSQQQEMLITDYRMALFLLHSIVFELLHDGITLPSGIEPIKPNHLDWKPFSLVVRDEHAQWVSCTQMLSDNEDGDIVGLFSYS